MKKILFAVLVSLSVIGCAGPRSFVAHGGNVTDSRGQPVLDGSGKPVTYNGIGTDSGGTD